MSIYEKNNLYLSDFYGLVAQMASLSENEKIDRHSCVQIDEYGKLKISSTDRAYCALSRSSEDKERNKAVRTAFLRALNREIDIDMAHPEFEELKFSDFSCVDSKDGMVSESSKPLTLYRITQILLAVANKFEKAPLTAGNMYSKISDTKTLMSSLVDLVNSSRQAKHSLDTYYVFDSMKEIILVEKIFNEADVFLDGQNHDDERRKKISESIKKIIVSDDTFSDEVMPLLKEKKNKKFAEIDGLQRMCFLNLCNEITNEEVGFNWEDLGIYESLLYLEEYYAKMKKLRDFYQETSDIFATKNKTSENDYVHKCYANCRLLVRCSNYVCAILNKCKKMYALPDEAKKTLKSFSDLMMQTTDAIVKELKIALAQKFGMSEKACDMLLSQVMKCPPEVLLRPGGIPLDRIKPLFDSYRDTSILLAKTLTLFEEINNRVEPGCSESIEREYRPRLSEYASIENNGNIKGGNIAKYKEENTDDIQKLWNLDITPEEEFESVVREQIEIEKKKVFSDSDISAIYIKYAQVLGKIENKEELHYKMEKLSKELQENKNSPELKKQYDDIKNEYEKLDVESIKRQFERIRDGKPMEQPQSSEAKPKLKFGYNKEFSINLDEMSSNDTDDGSDVNDDEIRENLEDLKEIEMVEV